MTPPEALRPQHRISPTSRLALLMDGHLRDRSGKMGFGLLRYSSAPVVCVIAATDAGGDLRAITGIDTDVPIVADVAEAAALGADVLVIAVATSGGVLPPGFRSEMLRGLSSGMSLVNGLHGVYADEPDLAAALQPGSFIWDVRQEPPGLGSGRARALELACRRVLTVGTDMAVGKMTASIELDRAASARGLRSRFLATGQIGMCISGGGIALDAVRVDFASAAVEAMCIEHGSDHDVLWIEGQGSALHPGSTAWVALLRGSVPTDLVLVHRPGQTALEDLEHIAIPPLPEVIALYEAVAAAAPAYPRAKVGAIALNCSRLTDEEADRAVEEIEELTGIPTVDVMRHGTDRVLDALLGAPRGSRGR